MNKTYLFKNLILVSLFMFTACAHPEAKPDANPPLESSSPTEPEKKAKSENASANSKSSVSIEAKLAAAQDNSADVTEIVFPKGSTEITKADAEKISKAFTLAVQKAKRDHTFIKRVIFLVWSDSEMPALDQKALPEDAIRLADARGEALKKSLSHAAGKVHLSVINLAKQPSHWKKFIRGDSVRIRESLESAKTGEKKASHAVVVMVRKKN